MKYYIFLLKRYIRAFNRKAQIQEFKATLEIDELGEQVIILNY